MFINRSIGANAYRLHWLTVVFSNKICFLIVQFKLMLHSIFFEIVILNNSIMVSILFYCVIWFWYVTHFMNNMKSKHQKLQFLGTPNFMIAPVSNRILNHNKLADVFVNCFSELTEGKYTRKQCICKANNLSAD